MKTYPPGLGRGCWLLVVCLAGMTLNGCAAPKKLYMPPLPAVDHSPQLPGKFVWADLVTDDVPAARNFYGRMFGWTFSEVGNYTIAANDERPLGGIFQPPRPADASAKPRWLGYLSVSSVRRA